MTVHTLPFLKQASISVTLAHYQLSKHFLTISIQTGTLVYLGRNQREGCDGCPWMQNLLCQNTIINSKLEQQLSPMKYVLPQVPPNAFLRVTVNHAQRKVYFKDVRMCRKITRRPTPPLPDYNSTTLLGVKLDFNTDEDNQEDSCCLPQGPQQ